MFMSADALFRYEGVAAPVPILVAEDKPGAPVTGSGALPRRASLRIVREGEGAPPRAAGPAAPPPASATTPVAQMDEAALCEAALQGRRDAWDALIRRHNHRVVVSLLGRGVRIDRAQELAQEAWARLVEQQREGRLQRLSLPGLAVTQAAFLSLDDLRRRQPGSAGLSDGSALAAGLADPSAGVEERLLSREQLERAQAALLGCSPSAQKVFRLLYDNPAISHAEAAQQVGLSLQRVRQILCEVRKKLRVVIEE